MAHVLRLGSLLASEPALQPVGEAPHVQIEPSTTPISSVPTDSSKKGEVSNR